MKTRFRILFLACLPLPATTVEAQTGSDTGSAELAKRQLDRLRKSIDNMIAVQSVVFRSEFERTDMLRELRLGRFAGQIPKPPTVVTFGRLEGDLLLHRCDDGKDEILTHGRRRIARSTGDWEFAVVGLGDGKPMPFLLDPAQFFRALVFRKLEVARHSVGTRQDKPVEIFTLSFEGSAADTLGQAGVFPDDRGVASMRTAMGGRPGGLAIGGGPLAPTRLDLALFVDPVGNSVVEARVRVYQANPMAGRIRGALAGRLRRVEEEDDDDDEADRRDPAKPVFKDGLPVRKSKDMFVTRFDVWFSNDDEAENLELNARAKALLGLAK